MSGTGGWEAQRAILDRLRQPAPSLRILFMTPEKIARSDTLMRALHELRGRSLLDRIIVDEAHCVSNWGHVRCHLATAGFHIYTHAILTARRTSPLTHPSLLHHSTVHPQL